MSALSERGRTRLTPESILLELARRRDEGIVETKLGRVIVRARPNISKDPDQDREGQPERNKESTSPSEFLLELQAGVQGGFQKQMVIAMGQSGAGKTSSIKEITNFFVELNKTGNVGSAVKWINQALPVISLFTNASTSANDNSTRCISEIELVFGDSDTELTGLVYGVRALESGRVASGNQDFHIFKQLPSLLESVNGLGNTDKIAASDTSASWKVIEDLYESQAQSLVRLLMGLVELRNIDIPKPEEDEVGDIFATRSKQAASLLGVTPKQLIEALGWDRAQNADIIPRDIRERQIRRSGLGASIYRNMVQGLLTRFNNKVKTLFGPCQGSSQKSKIMLVDIPGFECFDYNGLDQFGVNYINEHFQSTAAEIIHVDKWTSETPESATAPKSPSLAACQTIAGAIQDHTKGLAKSGARLNALFKTAMSEVTDNVLNVDHYAGKVPYQLHDLLHKNFRMSSSIAQLSRIILAPFNSSAIAFTDTSQVIAGIKADLRDFRLKFNTADQHYIICCIRDLDDRNEMDHIALEDYLAIMSPKYPRSMNLASFNQKYLPESSGLASIVEALEELVEARAELYRDDFRAIKERVYVTESLYRLLERGYLTTDGSDAGDVTIDHGYSLQPGQEVRMDDLLVQLEEREAEIEGLEVNVQGLNIKLGDANTANLALRGQVAISEEQVSALLNVKQANEVELGKRASLIASLTKQLENMRSERDLDRNGFDEQLREKNLAIEQVKGSLADKIADNEQMDATVSQQTAKIKALESSLTHQKEIEEGFKHRLELADINKEKLESDLHTMESKMSTCLHDIQAGQDLVKLSKQDNVELRNGFMNWLGDTLSRLSFHAGSIEERKQVLNRYVKRLGNAIAVIQSSADDKQLLVEVLKSTIQVSARSSRPAETTLPMLHLLRLMEATPGKGGLSRKIWGELRDAGIKEFQSSALAGMVRSAEKEGSRLRAATVIDGIHTLLTGGEVMDDRESVLYPVLSGFVRHLLRHSRDSNSAGGEYTYVFTQKKLRRQIIDLKVQHPKAEAFLNSIITGKR